MDYGSGRSSAVIAYNRPIIALSRPTSGFRRPAGLDTMRGQWKVDVPDSKSSTERCVGSIPTLGTTYYSFGAADVELLPCPSSAFKTKNFCCVTAGVGINEMI